MQIHVTFDSLEEMKEFIDKTYVATPEVPSGSPATEPSVQAPQQAPVPPVVPVQTQAAPPVQQAPVQSAPAAAVPTSATTYSMDDLARAGMTLMDSGHQTELQQLLVQFGVNSLPELPVEQYGAFATALRGLGAQI